MCNALMSFATYQLLHCISQSQHDAQGFIIYTNIAVAQQHKHRPSLKPQLCNFKRRARTQCDFSQHGVHGQWRSTPVRWCTCNLHQHSERTIINVIIYLCVILYRSGKIQPPLCLLAMVAWTLPQKMQAQVILLLRPCRQSLLDQSFKDPVSLGKPRVTKTAVISLPLNEKRASAQS